MSLLNPSAYLGHARRAARTVLAALMVGSAGIASAGFVTTYELQLEAIFSQMSFEQLTGKTYSPSNPIIDIRFNPTLTRATPSLLAIDLEEEFSGAAPSLRTESNALGVPNFTVAMFFVDSITYCGDPGTNIIGCGSSGVGPTGRGLIALNSNAATSNSTGALLLAHELGHNLGLDHPMPSISGNLMNGTLNSSNSALNSAQATTVLNSPLVRTDAANNNQLFISITPIAIVAAIPEPQTWMMLGLGLLGVAGWARRRRACAG